MHQPAVADLLVSAGRIERIAPRIDAPPGAEVIDAANKLVVPGFVNAHYHSHDVLMKGLFEELPFDIWTSYTGASAYGPRSHRETRIRTLIGAAEMLRNGITTVQDFLTVYPADEAYVDTVLAAYDEAGIRVNFAIAARDRTQLDIAPLMAKDLPEAIRSRIFGGAGRTAQQELDFVAGQIKRLGMNPRPLITWALAPSAPQRCTPELLEGLAALSRDHKLPVFTHVYETRPQAAAARVQSVSLLDLLQKAGLLNERLNLVHGVWLSAGDIEMLAQARARVVHNPMSNLKLKSGAAPILDLHRAGVEIALGCDNYSCAETQNIFVAMRMLCLLPAITSPEPHPVSAALRAPLGDAHRRQSRCDGGPDRRAEARHGGGPDDPRSQRAGVRAAQQRGAADRVLRVRRRGRHRAGRRPSRGARPQASHRRRGGACRRSGRDFAGLPQGGRSANQAHRRSRCPAARGQPRRVENAAWRRALRRRTEGFLMRAQARYLLFVS